VLFDSFLKHALGLADLHANLGQETDLKRRTVLINQVSEVYPVELKVAVLHFKIFLGKMEGLIYQVSVSILDKVGKASVHPRGKALEVKK
jgi:hypothetical protein